MAIPVIAATSTPGGSANTLTVSWPAGHTINDVMLLYLESANETIPLATASGFVAIGAAGIGTAGGTSATGQRVFWCRADSTAMADVVVADAGNHVGGVGVVVRGATETGAPYDVAQFGTQTAATALTISGATSTAADELVLVAVARPQDTAVAQLTGWANSDLANITEIFDAGWTAGNGGGLAIITGEKATAGAFGDTTATLASSEVTARSVISIKPAVASTVSGTGALTLAVHQISGTGTPHVVGTATITQAGHQISGSGFPYVYLTVDITLTEHQVAGSGVHGSVTGTGALTLAAHQISGAGTPHIVGTGTVTQASHQISGNGFPYVYLTADVTLGEHQVAATGFPYVYLTADVTLGEHQIGGSGQQPVRGTAALIQAGHQIAGSGDSNGPDISGTGAITLATHQVAATGAHGTNPFDDRELSVQDGAPYELYELTDGTTTWYYTSADHDVEFQNHTWLSVPCYRDPIVESDEDDGGSVVLHVARDLSVVTQFVNTSSPEPVWLKVWAGHFGLPTIETIAIWHGKVANVEFDDAEAKLQCLPVQRALRARVPRWTCQATCNNALYDTNCGVTEASFQITATVGTISGATIVLTAAPTQTAGYFSVGILRYGSIKTMIRTHSGANLVLMKVPTGITVGAVVTVSAGCDRDIDTCRVKFNNVVRFRGFPYVPKRNPFKHGVE